MASALCLTYEYMTLGNAFKSQISIPYREVEAGIFLPRKRPSDANTGGLESISQVWGGETIPASRREVLTAWMHTRRNAEEVLEESYTPRSSTCCKSWLRS